MKTIYTILLLFILSSSSLSAQIEGMLGDILKEVQDKVGDAQQKSKKEADETKEMKDLKNQIKSFISGIDDLDKYSSELKCVYLMLKLAGLYQGLESGINNSSYCQEKYDLYGMQLMVLASTTGIGYCYDDMWNLWMDRLSTGTDNYERYMNFKKDYEQLHNVAFKCIKGIELHNIENCRSFEGSSKLEIDFVITLGMAITTFDTFNVINETNVDYYIDKLVAYLTNVFNPVMALGKSVKIGQKMKALPCSDGRTYN